MNSVLNYSALTAFWNSSSLVPPNRLHYPESIQIINMTVPEHPIDTPPRAPSPVHRFGTLAVHAGSPHDPVTGAVIESVCTSGACFTYVWLIEADLALYNICANCCWEANRRVRVLALFEPEPVRIGDTIHVLSANALLETILRKPSQPSSTPATHSHSPLVPLPQPTFSNRSPQVRMSFPSQTFTEEPTATSPR